MCVQLAQTKGTGTPCSGVLVGPAPCVLPVQDPRPSHLGFLILALGLPLLAQPGQGAHRPVVEVHALLEAKGCDELRGQAGASGGAVGGGRGEVVVRAGACGGRAWVGLARRSCAVEEVHPRGGPVLRAAGG